MRPNWLYHRDKVIGLLQAAQWLIDDAAAIVVSCRDLDDTVYGELNLASDALTRNIYALESFLARQESGE